MDSLNGYLDHSANKKSSPYLGSYQLIPSYLASQQLQNIRLYLCDFPICTALVFPLPCTQAALNINLAAFLEVLASNLG